MLDILMYWVGWLLFVAGQAQNSINSPSNSLNGFAGFKKWLGLHWYTLVLRGFFSAIGEGAIQHFVIAKVEPLLQPYGFSLAVWGMAGIAGFAANTLLYQTFGLLGNKVPWLRVEVPMLAPPTAGQ
jgi:hypothetical protein